MHMHVTHELLLAHLQAAHQIPLRTAAPALPKIAVPEGASATGAASTETPTNGALTSPHLTANEVLSSPPFQPLPGAAVEVDAASTLEPAAQASATGAADAPEPMETTESEPVSTPCAPAAEATSAMELSGGGGADAEDP